MTNLYAERDIENLPTYHQHVHAMTAEGLHSKAAIAAELAWRDQQIAQWKALAEHRKAAADPPTDAERERLADDLYSDKDRPRPSALDELDPEPPVSDDERQRRIHELTAKIDKAEAAAALRALHCRDYADMPEDVRHAIPEMVVEVLRQDKVDAAAVLAACKAEGSNWTQGIEDESNVRRLRHER